MSSEAGKTWRRLASGTLENALFLLFLCVCVVAVTWPWARGFGDSFAAHQDPPLHAWKVWNVAAAVLQGHLRPPGIDLNAYYPHSGSLFYESLYWPQGVAAAPVLAITGNPVLAFHLSYLFFWALSGVCFKLMMQELGAGKAAACLGGLVFAIMPYRTGYVVEFNMQLCFALPLMVWALARWTRTCRILPAALAAAGASAALCLQAASELYQAVFFAMGLPFVALALGRGRWREWLGSRRFWVSAAAAAMVAAVVAGPLLAPFAGQLGNSVARGLEEVSLHELEPFSYLASAKHMRWCALPHLAVKEREICVYPTLAVAFAAAAWMTVRFFRHWRDSGPWERGLRLARAVLFLSFLAWTAVGLAAGGLGAMAPVYAWLPVPLAVLSLAIPAVSACRGERERLLDGLCGAALFAFLMGLGPVLAPLGHEWNLESPLYMALYGSLPFLQGFRVVARFGIVVLLFAVAAATLACDAVLRTARRCGGWRGAAIRLGVAAGMALTVAESVPLPLPGRLRGTPLEVELLDALAARGDAPVALAVFPGVHRTFDSLAMFRIAGTDPDRLLVMAWGGATPPFTKRYMANYRSLGHGKPEKLHRQLASLWPECRLLIHKKDFKARYPAASRRQEILDDLRKIADPEAGDGDFSLWRLRPLPPSREVDKFIRSDLLAARPVLRFRVVPGEDCPAAVDVTLDGDPVDRLSVPSGGTAFRLDLGTPRHHPVAPNHLHFSSGIPVSIEDFRCEARLPEKAP